MLVSESLPCCVSKHDLISSSPGYGGSGTRGSEYRFGFADTNFSVNSYNVGYPHDMWEGGLRLHVTHTQLLFTSVFMVTRGTYYSVAMNETNILGSNFRVFFEITNSGKAFVLVCPPPASDDIASTLSEWQYKRKYWRPGLRYYYQRVHHDACVVFNNTPALDFRTLTSLFSVKWPCHK